MLKQSKNFFLAGTGTDVGKTYVTAGLIHAARQKGLCARAIKPVLSGFNPAQPEASDAGKLLEAMGDPVNENDLNQISPWRFKAPLAPPIAAAQEGQTLNIDAILSFCHEAEKKEGDYLFLESAGGIMSPLTHDETMLDLAEALNWPILLVTGNYVGTISHALTALAALRGRSLSATAILINETQNSAATCEETCRAIKTHTSCPLFFLAHGADESFDALLSHLDHA